MRGSPHPRTASLERRWFSLYSTVITKFNFSDHLHTDIGELDNVSVRIINQFNPTLLMDYTPRMTVGDGNCLYRSASLGLFGSQSHHLYVRFLTALEMIEHCDHYDINSPAYTKTIDDTIVRITPNYDDLILSVTTVGSYADLMHLYGLSAALSTPIKSFCPSDSSSEITNPHNVAIRGREVQMSFGTELNVMWTMVHLPDEIENFRPNHVVLLVRNRESHDEEECNLSIQSEAHDCAEIVESQKNDHRKASPLNNGNFLNIDVVITLLRNRSTPVIAKIPLGLKENVYFLVDNTGNVELRKIGKKSLYEDDCGAWTTTSAPTIKSAYIETENGFKVTPQRNGLYCSEKKSQR